MEQNISFLKNTQFGKWIDLQSELKQEFLNKNIDDFYKSMETVEEPFKSFVLKAFGFDGVSAFLLNPKLFFTALQHIPKYEAFIDILESIFGSRDIEILEEQDGISINIVSVNELLKAYYIEQQGVFYNNKLKEDYVGFSNGDYSSLNWFFTHLINRFITAGIKIKSLEIRLIK